MASTDFDGTKLMMIGEGQPITLVHGDVSYRGTLQLRVDGFQENWYIKLDDGEIEIHKREAQYIESANALAVDGDGKKLLDNIQAAALSPEMAEKVPYEPEKQIRGTSLKPLITDVQG